MYSCIFTVVVLGSFEPSLFYSFDYNNNMLYYRVIQYAVLSRITICRIVAWTTCPYSARRTFVRGPLGRQGARGAAWTDTAEYVSGFVLVERLTPKTFFAALRTGNDHVRIDRSKFVVYGLSEDTENGRGNDDPQTSVGV